MSRLFNYDYAPVDDDDNVMMLYIKILCLLCLMFWQINEGFSMKIICKMQ